MCNGKPAGKRSALRMSLDAKQTRKLLTESCSVYSAEINDLLLTAFSMACNRGTGKNTIAIKLETHGRSVQSIRLPIERTVGWFTGFYPVVLEVAENVGDCIVKTRSILKAVPDNGAGYGVLAYGVKPVINAVEPNVVFNYMGEMDENSMLSSQTFSPSEIDCGDAIDPGNFSAKELMVNGAVQGGKLQFTFTYDTGYFDDLIVSSIVSAFTESLIEIMHHCSEVVNGTASRKVSADDFNLEIMNQEEFSEMLSSINELLE